MSLFYAVVWTGHKSAQILQFDAEHVQAQRIRAHAHYTAQHGSTVGLSMSSSAKCATRSRALPRF
jgi:hypothetical protein